MTLPSNVATAPAITRAPTSTRTHVLRAAWSERPAPAIANAVATSSKVELIYTALAVSDNASASASAFTDKWTALRVHTGDAAQLPDPVYEAAVGIGNAPAYRGRATLMIEGLQLGNSGQVPVLTFEVLSAS